MNIGKQNIAQSSISRELIFGQVFAVIASFVSDFLKPLGNITFYIFLFSAVVVLILAFAYLTKKIIKKGVFKYLVSAISVMILSGFFYLFQDESNSDAGILATNFPAIGNLQSGLGVIEKNLSEIKESTLRTEQLVESLAEDSKVNIKQTKELNQTIKDSSDSLINKLDELNDSFTEISKLGGLIVDPQNPVEFFHNSRVYEERGDYFNARKSYNQYFAFKLDFIDPHLRYQTFLKIQEGRAGAREVYNSFFENDQRAVIEYLKILLFNAPTRTKLLKDFISRNPDFAPAYYELSKDYSPSRTGQETLSNRRLESEALETFILLNNEGKFVRYFLDKALAAEWIKYAEERLKILNSGLNEIKESYFNDGTIFKQTNYRNGVREGEELVYKGKNDSITVFNGEIVNHRNQGSEVGAKVNTLSWYKGENILVSKNFYAKGDLEKRIDIFYYKTGEVFRKETSIPAKEESIKSLERDLFMEKYLLENRQRDSRKYESLNCDRNRNSMDCLGLSGMNTSWEDEKSKKRIKELEQKINNSMQLSGPYQYFYKNGQVEDEGTLDRGHKSSYSFFSKDGRLEEKGSIKNYFYQTNPDFKFLHGSYERYHANGQLMLKGEFDEGELLAPYKIYFDDGSVYLDKNTKGEYKKFDRNKLLVLEIRPTKCVQKKTYSRVSNSRGMETASYACFIKKSMNGEGDVEEETISIRPFTSRANCLKPTHTCEGISPNFIGKFFD
tara:strand:+ start:3761 stop:5947 length:2187 start_codon:yes stop_codon:yes gene_type:complete